MVVVQNISISSSSESSLRVASHVSSRTGATTRAEARGQSGSGSGSTSVRANGLVFDATYQPDPEGLEVLIRAFDLADPSGTRVDVRLLLRAGDRRRVNVPRAHGKPTAKFELFCVNGGVQAFFDDP
jgi:hypothetical protein